MRLLFLLPLVDALTSDGFLRYYASCARGLEGVLEEELRGPLIGAKRTIPGSSGVEFDGEEGVGYRATLQTRVGNRVLERLAGGPARSSDDVYELTRQVPWKERMRVDRTLSVEAVLGAQVPQQLQHTHFTALTVKNAIVDSFRDSLGARPSVDSKNADLPLLLYLHRGEAVLYRSYSAGSLHRRGYRDAMHPASLRETLASGCLLLAGVNDETKVICDPMCGSGTLAIEAALMARGVAPGLTRHRNGIPFAPSKWADFDDVLWTAELEAAESHVIDPTTKLEVAIFANDVHDNAIALASNDAKRAGVLKDIVFENKDAAVYKPPRTPDLVLSNPPWDLRLHEGAGDSWQAMGTFLRNEAPGATAHILCGNMPLSRELRMRANSRKKIFSGGLDLRLLRYDVFGPDSKKQQKPADVQRTKVQIAAPVADYTKLTVVDLKAELRQRCLKLTGLKTDLVQRLADSDAATAKEPVSTSSWC